MIKEKIEANKAEKLKKKAAFFRAQQAGVAREIALNNGGTGELRMPLSQKEYNLKKARRKQAKLSRRANRK
ncbi:hypothetical protein ACTWP4_00390 [Gracilibacillus sp. D59]|uniref:hypothetical protein n=1 Tax=Gracilibacillus sp. D59 TaxID=3457434 RepID=UPI003FCCF1AA